jgi:hypothetical protein
LANSLLKLDYLKSTDQANNSNFSNSFIDEIKPSNLCQNEESLNLRRI